MFLRLSRGVPLSILPGKRTYDDQLPLGVFSLLISEASRIRSLHMCISTTLLEKLSPDIWSAPLLESVTLQQTDDDPPAEGSPTSIRNAVLPALRSLSTTTFSCTFARGFFRPTLTKLIIYAPDMSLSIAEWVDTLNALPLLAHLILEDALPQGSVPPGLIATRVEMRHLAHLELLGWDSAMQCAHLLAHLSLPSCRTLALNVRSSAPRTTSEFHHLFSSISSALGSAFAPQSASLQPSQTSLSVHLWRATLPLWKHAWVYATKEPYSPSEAPAVALDIDSLGTPLPPDTLRTLVGALPLEAVRALRLWDGDTIDCHDVRPLAALRRVEALVYVCPRPLDLLRTLGKPSELLLFPELKHLALRHAKWHVHGERCIAPYSDPPLSSHVDAMLATRAEMGVPLKDLHLQGLRRVDKERDLGWFEEGKKDVRQFEWDMERWECNRPSYPCLECAQRSALSIGKPGGDVEGDLDSDVEFSDLD